MRLAVIAMQLDTTITLGSVIQIATTLGGLFVAYAKLRERLVAMETRLDPLWSDFVRRRTAHARGEDEE